MNKREWLKNAKYDFISLYHFIERPKKMRDIESIHNKGYRYLRIRIEDVDTGEIIFGPIYTNQKPDCYESLFEKLFKLIKMPKEYLKNIIIPEWIDKDMKVPKNISVYDIYDEQISGGKNSTWENLRWGMGYDACGGDSIKEKQNEENYVKDYLEKHPEKTVKQAKGSYRTLLSRHRDRNKVT